MATIKIRVDKNKLEKTVTLDQMIGLQEGDLRLTADVMSLFVLDEDEQYIEKIEARKILGGLTMEELRAASTDFQKKVSDSVVSPTSGND